MNLKELLKQRVDNEDLLPDLPQELKDKNTEIAKAYKEGYEQGQKDAERRGQWEKIELYAPSGDYVMFQCSECASLYFETSSYCPNCGARMKEGGE